MSDPPGKAARTMEAPNPGGPPMPRRQKPADPASAIARVPASLRAGRPVPADAADDMLIQDPLFTKEGGLHVRLCGHELPLLDEGRPLERFQPGWRARALFTGFAPLFLLELVHETGERATWFLDYRLQRVAGAVELLPPDLLELLTHKAAALLHALMHQVLEATMPALDARMRGFLGLNEHTRRAVAEACGRGVVRRPAVYLVRDLMPHSLVYRGQDGVLRAIDQVRLSASLAEDWQHRIPGFVRSGRLSWSSPVDGQTLLAQGALPLDDLHHAYRIVDHRNALVFFVLVGGHRATTLGLWFPTLGLLVAPGGRTGQMAAALLDTIQGSLLSLAVVTAGDMIPYLARGAVRFAGILRGLPGAEAGRQLWNELSGIEWMVRDHPDALPQWLVPDAARGTEFYGPLDELFGALRGRVDRTVGGYPDLVRHCFVERLFPLRITDERVPATLRDRLLQRVAASPEASLVAASLPRSRGLVLVFGLRVENGTLVELADFLARFTAFVAAAYPGATLVFDGHNAPVGGKAAGGPVGSLVAAIERALVDSLRQAFYGAAVNIVDTIGKALASSLAWTARSDAFVAIWGGNLAKYRWVCNRPGYVMSSRTNLMHGGDLHVYDRAPFVEDSSPMRLASAHLITDRPDVAPLVPGAADDRGLCNFDVDHAGILAEIREVIDRIVAGGRAA